MRSSNSQHIKYWSRQYQIQFIITYCIKDTSNLLIFRITWIGGGRGRCLAHLLYTKELISRFTYALRKLQIVTIEKTIIMTHRGYVESVLRYGIIWVTWIKYFNTTYLILSTFALYLLELQLLTVAVVRKSNLLIRIKKQNFI